MKNKDLKICIISTLKTPTVIISLKEKTTYIYIYAILYYMRHSTLLFPIKYNTTFKHTVARLYKENANA